MNGWTAYHGIVETGRARPGETVLVSAAAVQRVVDAAPASKRELAKVATAALKVYALVLLLWQTSTIFHPALFLRYLLQSSKYR